MRCSRCRRKSTITAQAERRLKVLQSLDTLGAGFQLASHDLDIRGAGNLLGEEQSGHIKEVGFELYQQMLEEAVMSLKAGITAPVADRWSPQITIGTPVLIPEDYVADLSVRLGLYRRLADDRGRTRDRRLRRRAGRPLRQAAAGGRAPAAGSSRIKALCRRANVEKVEAGPKGIVLSFRDNIFANPEGLIAFIREQGSAVRMRNDPKNCQGPAAGVLRDWPRPQGSPEGHRRRVAASLRRLPSRLRPRDCRLVRHPQYRLYGLCRRPIPAAARLMSAKRIERDHALDRETARRRCDLPAAEV